MNEAAARAIPASEAVLEHIVSELAGSADLAERFLYDAALDALDNEQDFLLVNEIETRALRALAAGDAIARELLEALEDADEVVEADDADLDDGPRTYRAPIANRDDLSAALATVYDLAIAAGIPTTSIREWDGELWANGSPLFAVDLATADELERLAAYAGDPGVLDRDADGRLRIDGDPIGETPSDARVFALARTRAKSLRSAGISTARAWMGIVLVAGYERPAVLRFSKRLALDLRTRTLPSGEVSVFQRSAS
jgi:hypothetical protein